jgi:archaellum component FlaF (FlaF/FlaG flagellin family)
MKKAQIKFFILAFFALCVSWVTNISTSRATQTKATNLTIVNKTDSRIDAIEVADGGDILPQEEMLMPNETVTVRFQGGLQNANVAYKVKLIFADGSSFEMKDCIAKNGQRWEVCEDGLHQN